MPAICAVQGFELVEAGDVAELRHAAGDVAEVPPLIAFNATPRGARRL